MPLQKRDLYRFPWSKNDNPIAWLEVTDICNLRCEGCYRQKMTGHKPLEQVRQEILFYKEWRNPDNVSIAGGEPLLHPEIMDIVAFIAENGIKPILLTNGTALDSQTVRELRKAGLSGFTIHVDSHQGRPGWKDKGEAEHNLLRQQYADLIAAEGGLVSIFNSTIYPSTYQQIPDVVRWGQANTDRVHGLVFITYRTFATEASIAMDAAGDQVDASQLGYSSEHFDEAFVTSPEVYRIIKDNLPQYEPSGYLGGTVLHDSYKWLVGAVIVSRNHAYGSIGPKTMELAQAGHHLLRGTYLAYLTQPRIVPLMLLLSVWDPAMRRAAQRWLADVIRHPRRLFGRVGVQSIGIIQAPDVQGNGQIDMCDSCPDMTVWEGNLVNSCRMDEYRLFGGLVSVAGKDRETAEKENLQPTRAAGP